MRGLVGKGIEDHDSAAAVRPSSVVPRASVEVVERVRGRVCVVLLRSVAWVRR